LPDKGGLLRNKAGLFLRRKIVLAEVLAAWGQLVMNEQGEYLLQLEEKTLAGFIAIGIHVKYNG
jgi:hypothetical protein